MSNIVWSADQGWHDGPPAVVTLDERGRIVSTPVEHEEPDGAPVEQWEVTTPAEVYMTEADLDRPDPNWNGKS